MELAPNPHYSGGSQCLLKQRMMEVVSGDNWSHKSCKAPVKSSPPTNQHPVLFTGRMPFPSPNKRCQSTEGKISHSMDLFTPTSPGVFQLCLWPLIAPGYLGGGLPCLSSGLWYQYPKTHAHLPSTNDVRKEGEGYGPMRIKADTGIECWCPQRIAVNGSQLSDKSSDKFTSWINRSSQHVDWGVQGIGNR